MTVTTQWHGTEPERVLLVTLDRPEKRNAVDLDSLLQLQQAQDEAAEGGARVLVLTGGPGAFCAGADLNGVEDGEFVAQLNTVLHGFVSAAAVTMAAVDGAAVGAGLQIAASCDLRIATSPSRFGIPAAKLGLAIDFWTVERLRSQLGDPITRCMLLAANTWNAEQLTENGFVQRIGGLDQALAWAAEIAGLAPLSIAAHKLMLERAPYDDIEWARARAWSSADAQEGPLAFLEKRPARFTGR
jgi:enoyl-CoA hydratase